VESVEHDNAKIQLQAGKSWQIICQEKRSTWFPVAMFTTG
jgi:hypothetical protein